MYSLAGCPRDWALDDVQQFLDIIPWQATALHKTRTLASSRLADSGGLDTTTSQFCHCRWC
eukprot:3748840-Amphidinium_carterae.1